MMKKMFFAAILALTAFGTVNAKESIDFIKSDGSAYRVTVDEDGWGRTTVSADHISRNQRAVEEIVAGALQVFMWLISK